MNSAFHHIHLIGICGTAMGSVAAMLHDQGYRVTGSDAKVYPPMSDFLRAKGIPMFEGFQEENLEPAPDLVIVGNAISRGNPELEAALDRRLYYLSLPEALKFFFLRHTHNLVVTGTHGKTTTTSLLAWIFQHAGREPSYLIGGIPLNFDQGCRRQNGANWILEGDEYDTAFFDKRSKFLHYLPELGIINNIEFDHADIYGSLDEIKTSFRRFVDIIPRNGMLVLNADDPHAIDVSRKAQCQLVEVGFNENAAVRITDFATSPQGVSFSLLGHTFTVPLFGRHNAHNAAMAIAASHFYQIPLPEIARALAAFRGIKRRLEIHAEVGSYTLVDDFGHHPTALRETISALRQKFPDRRIVALFEPRSNTTRRAVFQKELPAALALADLVGMTKVARADQLPEAERLDVERLLNDLVAAGKPALYEPEVTSLIEQLLPRLQPGDVICAFSNGSFDGLLPALAQRLRALS
ncbi:MAG: UDP-N-acetylmuramate:L-alanyl-gamma-D-glutamyl-me so-diaminopimelate ligase [Candidatus Methylacidiphilales bacterium]